MLGHGTATVDIHRPVKLLAGPANDHLRMTRLLKTLVFVTALSSTLRGAEWFEWSEHEGGSHFYSATDSTDWFSSQAEAVLRGGYLTTIGSIQELDFIRSTFGRTELFWTGLSTVNDGNNGGFEWVNGAPITYSYFSWRQPDPTQASAVIINQPNSRGFTRGFFYDVSPFDSYRGIVERDTNPNPTDPNGGNGGGPGDPNGVPDAGSSLLLLGLATLITALVRLRRY
ncbi:MAG TPA: hypothetical protein DCY13_12360 [Verrucomicrobiales bacterium]|nr:hypothetical protein [Verrucomicrobiales bacterium]